MTPRDTVTRSMHDLGLAAWFGGSLMGAVGLNGATAKAADPTERLRLSSVGWARWAPVQIAAITVHGIGGLGVIRGNRTRLVAQSGARQNTAAKIVLTAAAVGLTAWSGIEGRRVAQHQQHGGAGRPSRHRAPLRSSRPRSRGCRSFSGPSPRSPVSSWSSAPSRASSSDRSLPTPTGSSRGIDEARLAPLTP